MWKSRKSAGATDPAAAPTHPQGRVEGNADLRLFEDIDRHTDLKVELHQRLLDLINLAALDTMSREQIEDEVGDIVLEELAKQKHALNHAERKQLVDDVLDELLGPRAARAAAQGHDDHRHPGQRPRQRVRRALRRRSSRAPVRFKDEKHLLRIIQKIVSAVGRRVDESSPMVDARLADGSRVNAVVPPLALDGSLLSIRKFAKVPISMDRLIEIGSVPAQVAEVLKAVVAARLQRADFGRHRLGQDDHAQRHVGLHRRARADRDDRGFGRAAAAAGACRAAGDAPGQHRGQGRDRPARPGQERAAHAARPDHRRRSPRRRGVRHAAGDEHRPRRVDDHGSRQHAARCAVAASSR